MSTLFATLPGRFDPKYSRVPSRDNEARVSALAVFTFGPKGCGADHGSKTLDLVAV